ncbi:NAD(P)/FAD-dependent oxidoreductase [Methylobacterium sp. NFXW15]|uniref:NAD(P)/FAD-dependent oxidoreductase n=1 Tax=Methylobacterium sp. NFXW15 TaxID=2819512 RepID=UPI003CF07CA6
MSKRPGIVVVGASLAGLCGAEALRRGGYDGPLTLIGDEPHPPYDRPPLSKHVLAGELEADATALPHLVALRARWRLGQPATGLDRTGRTIRLADGSDVPFTKLFIATGARARTWTEQGADLSGIFTIRSRADAVALRRALSQPPKRVLIIGAGLIGCEAASCCRDLGLPVTLVDPNPTPLARVLGTMVGEVLAQVLRRSGVDYRPGARVRALVGEAGHVRQAHLHDSGIIDTDLVIVALGAIRETAWLTQAGLVADSGGVTCDEACRVLTREGPPAVDIVAAGDVARWQNPLYGGRLMTVEHWGNAVEQAAHAASSLLRPEQPKPYSHLPAFWSSQFGLNIKAVGLADGADAVAIVQGDRASRRFLAVYGRAGRSVAAVSFDQARWLPAYAGRIVAGAPFPPILDATDQRRIQILAPGFPPSRTQRPVPEMAHV